MTDAYRSTHDVIEDLISLEGLRVVDVGSGEGDLARWMGRRGAREVVGVECGDGMLAEALAGESAPGVRFVAGEGQALPLPDRAFDLVVFSNSLHHVPEAAQADALREAVRVLVPGGRLLVLEPLARGPYFELLRPVHDETRTRARALEEITGAVARGELSREACFEFERVARFESFEAARDRVLRINPHLKETVAEHDTRLRRAFETLGRRVDGQWIFPQPIWVELLSEPP